MAKESTSTSTSRPVPTKPTMIPVFNHTKHMIGVGISVRKAGTPGSGAPAYTVEFLPGNNSVDSRELDKCKAHPLWHINVERQEKRGLTGKKYKAVSLEVGLHDVDFEVESKELGDRMQQLHQKRVG